MGAPQPRGRRWALRQHARAVWDDLFGEEANGSDPASRAGLETDPARLAEAEARLAQLRQAAAAALARAHQAEAAWELARQATAPLDASVDQALRDGEDGLARARQHELNRRRRQVEALDQRRRREAAAAEKLALASRTLALEIAVRWGKE